MLDRALKYAKLYDNGKGKTVPQIAEKFNENEVTVYKLIRMGNAPNSIISLIKSERIPATVVANILKSSMTDKQMVDAVNTEVHKREHALKQLEKEGFSGGTSMTVRRAIKLALSNLKKKHLIKNDRQKAIADAFNDIFSGAKPSIADIENAILMN